MLPPMEIDVDTLRRLARLGGFEWTDAELETIRPALARALEQLRGLEALPLADVEPATQYRVL
jgi:Asp-tRNA(Asn)/Glu-tRNA(Gln) amidotransferase C subunit